MNTEDIEEKLEQFRKFLANVIMHQEDLMLNATDPLTADIRGELYYLARYIDREFIRTFPTKLTVKTDEQA